MLHIVQWGLFCVEAHGESGVHVAFYIQLLTGWCFILPPASAFSTSCFQEGSAPADKLMPAISAKKKKKTACHFIWKRKNKIWKVLPSGEALLPPLSIHQPGNPESNPNPKERAKAAPRARRAARHKLMIGNQEQGMQATKQNQILLSDLPLPSRRSHPCLLYPKPEHGIRNRLCNSFQPARRAQTQRPCPGLPWSVSLPPCW